MLPLFAPWALLPWDVAWFVWRVGTILLLLWTIHWAYRRRPLTTAVIVAVLAFPFGANLDTGNINLQLTLMLWAAQFTGPRLGGLLWALATWMKWVPVVFWPILPGRAKHWGLVWLAVSVGLSILTLPLTIIQLQALFGFGARPVRLDYLVYLWAAVPVALPQGGPVRLPAAGDLAALGRGARATRRRPAPAPRRLTGAVGDGLEATGEVLATALVDRPQQQRADAHQHDRQPERGSRPRGVEAGPADDVHQRPADRDRRGRRPTPSRRSTGPCTGPTTPSG